MLNRASFLCIVSTALGVGLVSVAPDARADKRIRCESKGYRHATCGIPGHGYVRLERQVSGTKCVQGRNWDFNQREIWVDDGCGGEFVVEQREHSQHHGGNDAAKAAAAIAAIALLGAVVHEDTKAHHYDEGYGRGGHSSHVPNWLVGDFIGYNQQVGSDVYMTIESNGRLRAKAGSTRVNGYVNDERLYVGDAVFEVHRSGSGIDTVQVGRWDNRVSYKRRK